MVYNVCVYIKKKKRTQLYRIRNEVSGVDLVSPFLHVLGRSLFVQVGYQMEKLYVTDVDLQKKVEIKIQSTLVVFCALLSVFFTKLAGSQVDMTKFMKTAKWAWCTHNLAKVLNTP